MDYRHHSDDGGARQPGEARRRGAGATDRRAAPASRARGRARPRPARRPRRARRAPQLVARVESSITADARARVAAGLLAGQPPTSTRCGPLVRNQVAGDEADLAKAVGRYSCVAVVRDAVQHGRKVGVLGIPFVAAVDFRRYTYVWCKDNPPAMWRDRAGVRPPRTRVPRRRAARHSGPATSSAEPRPADRAAASARRAASRAPHRGRTSRRGRPPGSPGAAAARRPFDGEAVADDRAGVEVALDRPGGDALAVVLADLAELEPAPAGQGLPSSSANSRRAAASGSSPSS